MHPDQGVVFMSLIIISNTAEASFTGYQSRREEEWLAFTRIKLIAGRKVSKHSTFEIIFITLSVC